MKLLHFAGLCLFALVAVASPGRAQDLGETVSQPGLFSYQAPKGWTVKDTSFSKYKVCFDVPKNKFAANINVVLENFSGPLDKYVDLNATNLKASTMFQNLKIVDQKQFTTTDGTSGVRMVVTDSIQNMNLQQVFYFFSGSSDNKFVVTASSLVGDGDTYAPIFDATLKTFSPK
jgi:hypothetical protein